ncbi:MAG: hypothetical protein NVS9B14_08980 [Candidatus Acidiferrum sp.]
MNRLVTKDSQAGMAAILGTGLVERIVNEEKRGARLDGGLDLVQLNLEEELTKSARRKTEQQS